MSEVLSRAAVVSWGIGILKVWDKSLVVFKHDPEASSGCCPTSQVVIANSSPSYPFGNPKEISKPRMTDGNRL